MIPRFPFRAFERQPFRKRDADDASAKWLPLSFGTGISARNATPRKIVPVRPVSIFLILLVRVLKPWQLGRSADFMLHSNELSPLSAPAQIRFVVLAFASHRNNALAITSCTVRLVRIVHPPDYATIRKAECFDHFGVKSGFSKKFATLDKNLTRRWKFWFEPSATADALCRSATAVWTSPLVPHDFYPHVLAPWTFKCALVVIRAIRLDRSQPHLRVARLARRVANNPLVRKYLIRLLQTGGEARLVSRA